MKFEYECCAFCKYFFDGKCKNKDLFEEENHRPFEVGNYTPTNFYNGPCDYYEEE